ncbi:glycosyltransferase family 4 protein [Dethiosulfovibrio sp. F2B]|uniref:glycosyltransferase family 4 protein n=1 Tax=Dethiosulfovibrio faecalis TaxID=2720018 RepID=UPI001F37AC65|nr:glycosyltransferase family 4 protein [Dethiosulfovibrio faecalis]MCF4151432.1 glycosyltransferase family 4 protein [Dethiosulfovibrio faecalis]
MRKNLKILHVLSQLPEYTGSGHYVQALLAESIKKGHRCFLLSAGSDRWSQRGQELPYIERGNRVVVPFESRRLPFPIPGMSDVMPYEHSRFGELTDRQMELYEEAFREALIHGVKTFSPDLIHCHHLWLLTSMTRRLFPEIPVIATSHGSDLRQMRNLPRFRAKVLEGCANLNRVLALSAPQKEEIQEIYGIPSDRISVVGGGYNSNLFTLQEKPEVPPVTIMYGGKISSEKGIPWLARSLGKVYLPWRLIVAGKGTGQDGKKCVEMLEALGSRVELVGQVPPSKMAALMGKSHVFVLPSLHEGLPLVLLEALACGCRVVATALPGVLEMAVGIAPSALETVPMKVSPATVWDPGQESLSNMVLALERQIGRTLKEKSPSIPQERLKSYTWESVFEKTEKGYFTALEETSPL